MCSRSCLPLTTRVAPRAWGSVRLAPEPPHQADWLSCLSGAAWGVGGSEPLPSGWHTSSLGRGSSGRQAPRGPVLTPLPVWMPRAGCGGCYGVCARGRGDGRELEGSGSSLCRAEWAPWIKPGSCQAAKRRGHPRSISSRGSRHPASSLARTPSSSRPGLGNPTALRFLTELHRGPGPRPTPSSALAGPPCTCRPGSAEEAPLRPGILLCPEP